MTAPERARAEGERRRDTDDHLTPFWLSGMFEGWFDPCPYPRPSWDGLIVPWKDKTFANIPYSRKRKDNPGVEAWINKAIKESGEGKRVVLLVRHDHSTGWYFKAYISGAHFLPIMERVQFRGEGRSPNFLSTLIIFEPRQSIEPTKEDEADEFHRPDGSEVEIV